MASSAFSGLKGSFRKDLIVGMGLRCLELKDLKSSLEEEEKLRSLFLSFPSSSMEREE